MSDVGGIQLECHLTLKEVQGGTAFMYIDIITYKYNGHWQLWQLN